MYAIYIVFHDVEKLYVGFKERFYIPKQSLMLLIVLFWCLIKITKFLKFQNNSLFKMNKV